jgi:hypothetical protein
MRNPGQTTEMGSAGHKDEGNVLFKGISLKIS